MLHHHGGGLNFLVHSHTHTHIYIYIYIGGFPEVVDAFIGNGYSDLSSNLGRNCLHFYTITLLKGMNPIILHSVVGK